MSDKIWTRRENESSLAYNAFKTYLYLGADRTLQGAADGVGKSFSLIRRWSSRHEWIDRSAAYDSHIMNADLDGLVHVQAESRDKNLALMDKLRGLLDMRLDDFISRRDDPTIRWTQAVTAMAKIEANSLLLGKEDKSLDKIQRVELLVERALELQNREPDRP